MNDKIGLGSVCVFKDLVYRTEYNGMECVVMIDHGVKDTVDYGGNVATEHTYTVKASNGDEGLCAKRNLKLKKPPAKDDEQFQSFMNKVLTPVKIMEEV